MAGKRVFIAFAMEDKVYRDFVVGHSLHPKSPFEFTNMSVKEPWSSEWKSKCRTRIKGCAGMIALISKSTASASGELWEIQCAIKESIPLMLMWINDDRPNLPKLISGKRVNVWSWSNIEAFIDRI